jgi:4-hydroxy-tetrahydrodipicolinate reductase
MNEKLKVCVAGATGWAASELCRELVLTDDLELVSAVSRKNASGDLKEILNLETDTNIPTF